MQPTFHHRRGFTLIELLIVVAIIGIIAAIAVPNFRDAKTRAMVARVQGDQHALAVSIVQFQLDQGMYLRRYCEERLNIPANELSHSSEHFFNQLSTPIAYISSGENVDDPFQELSWKRYRRDISPGEVVDQDGQHGERYGYIELTKIGKDRLRYSTYEALFTGMSGPADDPHKYYNDHWRGAPVPESYEFLLASRGPDLAMNIDVDEPNLPSRSYRQKFLVYDPSNGINSLGDIYTLGP